MALKLKHKTSYTIRIILLNVKASTMKAVLTWSRRNGNSWYYSSALQPPLEPGLTDQIICSVRGQSAVTWSLCRLGVLSVDRWQQLDNVFTPLSRQVESEAIWHHCLLIFSHCCSHAKSSEIRFSPQLDQWTWRFIRSNKQVLRGSMDGFFQWLIFPYLYLTWRVHWDYFYKISTGFEKYVSIFYLYAFPIRTRSTISKVAINSTTV